MKKILAATALAALLATGAVAQDRHTHPQHGRDLGGIIAGTIFGIVGQEILRDSSGHAHSSNQQPPRRHRPRAPQAGYNGHYRGVAQLPAHNPYNNPSLPGYTQGVNNPNKICSSEATHSGQWVIVRQYNCYGELLGIQKRPRY